MGYLINPFGRIVAIDDIKHYEELLNTPGFQKPTDEQIKSHIIERVTLAERLTNSGLTSGVYFATVTQGGADGYGMASAHIMRELQALGVHVSTTYTGQKVAILFHNPYSILRIEAPFRIIYTMFESDKIPDDWYDYLMAADKVLVPSHWCQSVFKKSGIDTEVVPLGYDQSIFEYKERPIQENKTFTFLHYNAFNIRKGFPEIFKAFTMAFRKDEPVKMIFKTNLENLPLPITPTEYPNIEIIRGKRPAIELRDIIYRSDCFVFPSRGEGFGVTPLEAMATGIPAILVNAHGMTEYFNEACMYEVPVKEMCPALYSRYKNQDVGKMTVCDIDELAKQMRWVYDHQDEARTKGKMASQWVKQWTIQKTAENIKAMYDDIITNPFPERQLRNVLTLEKIT